MNDCRIQKTIIVTSDHDQIRLDKYLSDVSLAALGEHLSRSRVLNLLEQQRIRIQGHAPKASYRVGVGDEISVCIPHLEPSHLVSYDLDLEILFEDSDCVVINKPSGLVVHPAAGHKSDTLVNALLSKIGDLTIGLKEQRPGIVHRLDKDTSGILVVAKNDLALQNLSLQFKEKTVDRHYHALVYGEVAAPSGTIQSQLSRHPTQRKKFASSKNGKIAITHFERLDLNKGISLLRCRLETGRTHQIRVHLSEKGHAIVNDPIYSSGRQLKHLSTSLRKAINEMNGIGLHAFELGFTHPRSGERLNFRTTWPKNLLPLVQELDFERF